MVRNYVPVRLRQNKLETNMIPTKLDRIMTTHIKKHINEPDRDIFRKLYRRKYFKTNAPEYGLGGQTVMDAITIEKEKSQLKGLK